MCPDVLQFLTYMAGRTTDLRLGSMVCVLPWHDPMRVAEQVAMLDNLSDGRFILGVGRGLAKVEYDGFRVDMNESRTRFIESAECLLAGLESGFCEFEGNTSAAAPGNTAQSFPQFPGPELRGGDFAGEQPHYGAAGRGYAGDTPEAVGTRWSGIWATTGPPGRNAIRMGKARRRPWWPAGLSATRTPSTRGQWPAGTLGATGTR